MSLLKDGIKISFAVSKPRLLRISSNLLFSILKPKISSTFDLSFSMDLASQEDEIFLKIDYFLILECSSTI